MTPQPKKWRFCQPLKGDVFFKPQGIPIRMLEIIVLGHDEAEAMRLCDCEELDQEAAAKKMNISRGTVQRLLWSGRKKVINALLSSKALKVESGEHIIAPSRCVPGRGRRWRHRGRF